jgi:hypothetical protein
MKKNLLFIAIIALFASLSFSACSDNENGGGDGKVDPNTIATANLIAHFPFEGNGVDRINNLTPTNANTTLISFPAGRRGKCFQGNANGDAASGLLYTLPANSKLKTLKAFTISLWVKLVPNTIATTDAPEQMVFQIDGTGDWIWGNLFLLQHRNWPEGPDEQHRNFTQMDCFFFKDDAIDWKGQRGNGWWFDITVSPWRHIICTYDNVTSTFHAYANGAHVTMFDGSEYTGVNRTQGEDGPPLGDLKFVDAEHLAIGAWCVRLMGIDLLDDAWASPFKGQIDEFRIYDRALTAIEAKALYDAEVSQVVD